MSKDQGNKRPFQVGCGNVGSVLELRLELRVDALDPSSTSNLTVAEDSRLPA
jgi:hypothetical protein